MLRNVCRAYPEAVLITGDDHLPEDHADVVTEVRATIATLEPWELHKDVVVPADTETSATEAYRVDTIGRRQPATKPHVYADSAKQSARIGEMAQTVDDLRRT